MVTSDLTARAREGGPVRCVSFWARAWIGVPRDRADAPQTSRPFLGAERSVLAAERLALVAERPVLGAERPVGVRERLRTDREVAEPLVTLRDPFDCHQHRMWVVAHVGLGRGDVRVAGAFEVGPVDVADALRHGGGEERGERSQRSLVAVLESETSLPAVYAQLGAKLVQQAEDLTGIEHVGVGVVARATSSV